MKLLIRQIRKKGRNLNCLIFIYLLITLSPFAFLTIEALSDISSAGMRSMLSMMFSGRRLALLWVSIALAVSVSITGMLAGSVSAYFLWRHSHGIFRYIRWLVLLFILIPPYVHAQSWIFAMDALNLILVPLRLPAIDFNGFAASGWVQLTAFLPMATGLALAGFEAVDARTVEAAMLDAPSDAVLPKIILPQAAPSIFAGGSLLFILSLSDYSIPSVFRLNVYALEIFSEYSSTNMLGRPYLLSLPCLAVLFAVLAGSQSWFSGMDKQGNIQKQETTRLGNSSRLLKTAIVLGLLISAFQVLVPLVNLLVQTGSPTAFISVAAESSGEILNTLITSFIAAVICIPVSLAAAASLSSVRKTSKYRWLAVAIPAALPASLTGIGAVAAWNQPAFNALYGTLVTAALVSVSRFAPFAAVILYAGLRGISPELRDASRLYGKNALEICRKVTIPLILPSLLAACCFVFALTAGELGATLIVCPPGKATLTLKIYNYLHYGATETVASLCLFMTLLSLLCGLLAALLITAGKGDKYEARRSIILLICCLSFCLSSCGGEPQPASKEGILVIRPPHDTNAMAFQGNILWAGGADGVVRIDAQKGKLLGNLEADFPIKYVKSLCMDTSGNLWIAHEKGLARFDGKTVVNLTTKDGLPDNRVNAVMQDRYGRIWVGTWGGAMVMEGDNRSIITEKDGLLSNMVNIIMEDNAGGIWFGSYNVPSGGISILKDGNWTCFNAGNGLQNNNITALYQDAGGLVWAATGFYNQGGAAKFKYENGQWQTAGTLSKKDGLAGEKVRSIFQTKDGILWFGSEYDGAAILKGGKLHIITKNDGLSDNEIKTLLQDEAGRLWIGTRDGITVIDSNTFP